MKDNFAKTIGSELKILRIENDDNQEELSKKTGIATSTISKYENGTENINLKLISKILNNYNIDGYIFLERILAKTRKG